MISETDTTTLNNLLQSLQADLAQYPPMAAFNPNSEAARLSDLILKIKINLYHRGANA